MDVRTVLLVDDSRVTRMYVEKLVEPYCSRVVSATTCRDALEALSAFHDVDLVISDVYLAAGDGFQLLEVISNLLNQPPVLLMTGREISSDDRQRAAMLGAIDYVQKPLRARAILDAWTAARVRRGAVPGGESAVAGTLHLADELGEPVAAGPLRELRPDAAVIPAEVPLPIGSRVVLTLAAEGRRYELAGRVAVVNAPSWGAPGSIDVAFDREDAVTRSRLALLFDSLLGRRDAAATGS